MTSNTPTNYPPFVVATPTGRGGNGFELGREYVFADPNQNGLYRCCLPNGSIRYEGYESLVTGGPTAHLWDGTDWKKAGQWEFLYAPYLPIRH